MANIQMRYYVISLAVGLTAAYFIYYDYKKRREAGKQAEASAREEAKQRKSEEDDEIRVIDRPMRHVNHAVSLHQLRDALPSTAYSKMSSNHDGSNSVISNWTVQTSGLMFFDVEPNLHFFKIYQDQLTLADSIPMPRTDRTIQLLCESQEEFLAKVSCLRNAFQDIIYDNENCFFFISIGKEILKIFLAQSPKDLENCLNAYDELLDYVGDESNHEQIEDEIKLRKIPVLSFYDLVVDYIILESLDDLENPPSMVASIVSNKWVSSKFRQSACQSAVVTALKYKRAQLKKPDGFFSHFYSVLDFLSPTLAWGFLGSDEELRFKCEFLKESLLGLCRDFFSFDRVRYTSYQDLKSDIMTVTRERYSELTERLTI